MMMMMIVFVRLNHVKKVVFPWFSSSFFNASWNACCDDVFYCCAGTFCAFRRQKNCFALHELFVVLFLTPLYFLDRPFQ